jgi:deazaflavin-dependent oxidoreductase (nitroreductase family)
MDTITTQTDEAYRLAFKRFNVFMIWMWRLGFRRWINAWPGGIGRIMVLIHTGRKSGLRRRTPVNYARIDRELYCTAGFGQVSDWYRNILANPHVEVWLPDGWWSGLAEDISDHDQRLPLLREVLIASGFAAPMFGIDPRKMDDRQLAAVSVDYRLIRIRLVKPLSGSGGPGDLSWVWMPIFLALALVAFVMRIRSKR